MLYYFMYNMTNIKKNMMYKKWDSLHCPNLEGYWESRQTRSNPHTMQDFSPSRPRSWGVAPTISERSSGSPNTSGSGFQNEEIKDEHVIMMRQCTVTLVAEGGCPITSRRRSPGSTSTSPPSTRASSRERFARWR